MADRRRLQKKAAAAALVAAVMMAASPPGADATCRCGRGRLELVFVIDTTSSMKAVVGTVREQCAKMIHVLEGHVENLRVGAVLYKTGGVPVDELDLTADRKSVVAFIRNIKVAGGGFEAVEEGLKAAVDGMTWTRGSRKVVVLIGDEPPDPQKEGELFRWAEIARTRGIVVNTVTSSETAWRYFKITHQFEYEKLYEAMGDEVKKDFRLPQFVKTAEVSGGKAVGGRNVRDIVRWLLSFGLGREVGKPGDLDMDEFFKWKLGDEPEPKAAGGAGAVLGRVSYRGEWRTPRDGDSLLRYLKGSMEMPHRRGFDEVRLLDEGLEQRPLLYISGHGPVALTDGEKTSLGQYLKAGGSIWADACCGSAEFDRTIRAVIREAAGAPLAPLPADHLVYSVGYDARKVRLCKEHRSASMVESSAGLEGVSIDGRLAVIYSKHSLGSTWRSYRFGLPCMMDDEDGRKLSANIILYFMSR